jgi:chromosome segregation protein
MAVYLKSIDLSGFKSFPVKTRIEFVEGITGIVGPNGSGKSNIVEDIKWVLGEQSAKSMRGDKMEDIIFNGTKDRSALGMADVQLTFANENHWLPLDFSEVSVARRIFRSGEGQYYINKSRVRLKDIVEMFLDTGIGKDSYAIFEQGKIDRLLSESPTERRILFEDFAGISKFKFRKEEAERKLENSRQNLERVNDVIIELDKEVERLKVQAEDANRYNELRKQLKSLEVKFEAMRVRNIQLKIDARVEKRNAVSEKMKPLAGDQKSKEDAIQTTDQEILDRETDYNTANENLRNLERESAELRSRISSNEERKESLASQIVSMENRLKDEENRLQSFREELTAKQTDLETAKESRDKVKQELDAVQAEIDEIFRQMKTLDDSTLARSRELGFDRIVSKDDIEKKRQEIIQYQASLQNYRSTLEEKYNQFRGFEENTRPPSCSPR